MSPSNLSFGFATIFEKTSTCDIHTEVSYKTEINKHIACGFLSLLIIVMINYSYANYSSKIEQYFYSVEDCLTKFGSIMNDISLKLINAEHKKCYH